MSRPQVFTRFKSARADAVADALNPHAEGVTLALLGGPNRTLSTKYELRYGADGRLVVIISGVARGQWYDHETGESGDLLDLIRREVSYAEAWDWADLYLNIDNNHKGFPGGRQSWGKYR